MSRTSSTPEGPRRPATDRLTLAERLHWSLLRIERRRVLSWLAAVVVAAAMTALVVRSRAVVATVGQTGEVAVAARNLEPGSVIEPGDVRWEQWPVGLIPDDSRGLTVVGATVRSAIAADEPVLVSRLMLAGQRLGPDERAVTIPVPLAPPPVRVGDIVELIGIQPAPFGDGLLQSSRLGPARIVETGDSGLTVAVDAARAVSIVEVMTGGSVEVLLTPLGS